eukprot:3987405-Pyramimonas_sp.AAC.1
MPSRVESWVAGKPVHQSHVLWCKASVYFCGACGAWATSRPVSLKERCPVDEFGPHALTQARLVVLQRLCKGLPPSRKISAWPDM